jgi:hypothetical protein
MAFQQPGFQSNAFQTGIGTQTYRYEGSGFLVFFGHAEAVFVPAGRPVLVGGGGGAERRPRLRVRYYYRGGGEIRFYGGGLTRFVPAPASAPEPEALPASRHYLGSGELAFEGTAAIRRARRYRGGGEIVVEGAAHTDYQVNEDHVIIAGLLGLEEDDDSLLAEVLGLRGSL